MMKLLLPLFLLMTFALSAQLERDSIDVVYDVSRHVDFRLIDVDGDGDLDIMASQNRGYNGNFVLYKNTDGQGTYAPGVAFGEKTWEGLPYVRTNFDMADMDNDGDLDLVSGNL